MLMLMLMLMRTAYGLRRSHMNSAERQAFRPLLIKQQQLYPLSYPAAEPPPSPGLLFRTFYLVLHVSGPSEQCSIRVNYLLISDRVTNKSQPREFPTDKHLHLSSFNLEPAHVARPTPRLGGRRVARCCTRTSPLQGRWSVPTLSRKEVYH